MKHTHKYHNVFSRVVLFHTIISIHNQYTTNRPFIQYFESKHPIRDAHSVCIHFVFKFAVQQQMGEFNKDAISINDWNIQRLARDQKIRLVICELLQRWSESTYCGLFVDFIIPSMFIEHTTLCSGFVLLAVLFDKVVVFWSFVRKTICPT